MPHRLLFSLVLTVSHWLALFPTVSYWLALFLSRCFPPGPSPRAIDTDGAVQKRVFVSTSRGTVVVRVYLLVVPVVPVGLLVVLVLQPQL